MSDLDYLKNWIEQIEINAKGIQRDINEQDKVYLQSSEILGMTMRIRKTFIEK